MLQMKITTMNKFHFEYGGKTYYTEVSGIEAVNLRDEEGNRVDDMEIICAAELEISDRFHDRLDREIERYRDRMFEANF